MSTYWFPFCRTCNTDEGRCLWWNHGVDCGLRDLISIMPELGAFARAYAKTALDLEIKLLGPEWTSDLLDFAANHGDHDVVAKNEYGVLDTECGESFSCPTCDHSKTCHKPKGHDGEHE